MKIKDANKTIRESPQSMGVVLIPMKRDERMVVQGETMSQNYVKA